MAIEYNVQKFDSKLEAAYDILLPEQTDLVAKGKLKWKYVDNPAASGLVSVGKDGEEIIGMIGFVPAKMKVGDRSAIGYQALDTVVSPAARGKFAFVRMGQAFYEKAPKLVDFVYGFPNAAAARGWFSRLGWTHLGMAPFLVKPLRAGYVLKRFFPAWVDFPLSLIGGKLDGVEKLDTFDASVDELWTKFSSAIGCGVVRDSRYLNWRLFQHPTAEYETWALRDSEGAIRSFVTTHVAHKHGGHIAYIMEAMGDETVGKLLRHVMGKLRRAKVEVVLAWCHQGSPNYSCYRKAGFFPYPERFRPIELHFGAKTLGDNMDAAVTPDSWYLSYLDSDTV